MAEIPPPEYETYLLLILSGQVPQEDVPRLLQENPAFAEWYRGQMIHGHRRRPPLTMQLLGAA
jgi:hypothetical protein